MRWLCLIVTALADLPVHCYRDDFAGSWKLHMGHPVSEGEHSNEVPDFANGGVARQYCYSGSPNRNSENVMLDIREKMPPETIARTIQVQLTLDVAINPDMSHHMLAHSPDMVSDKQNTWSTAYDEGWEVRLHDGANPLRMFALAKYQCVGEAKDCGKDGVGESEDGTVKGYQSHCGQSLVGWYSNNGEGTRGCFWAEKVDEKEAAKVHSFVVKESKVHQDSLLSVHTAYHHSEFDDFVLPAFGSVLELHRDGAHSKDYTGVRRSGSIKRFKSNNGAKLRVRDECDGDNLAMAEQIEQLEAEHPVFDWRDFAKGSWDTDPIDQGSCGSCYAIAMAYALQSRANIAVLKEAQARGKTEFPDPMEVSSHSVLSCSYFNQGCEGGYPYLVGKHAQEFGLPQESCMPYASAGDGNVNKCDAKCFHNKEDLLFAKDYNYVGGFYGVCGEYRVMQSLKEHGPLVVAIEVPAPFAGAGGGKIVGQSFLNRDRSLRQVSVNADGTTSQSGEDHYPEEHHRQNPGKNAKVLEAKWYLGEGCTSRVELTDLAESLGSSMPAGAFIERQGQRFAIDSDAYPADGNPYEDSKSLLAESLQVGENCIHMTMADGTMNGWEYTNHAISVVGWGQHEVRTDNGPPEIQKYWIIRNSWGPYYGDGGFAYVARGVDYAGIESQAVEVTPDHTRGLMKRALEEL